MTSEHRQILESVGPTLADSCGLKLICSLDGQYVKLAETTDEYELRAKLPDTTVAVYVPHEVMASGLDENLIRNEIVGRLEYAKRKLLAQALRMVLDDPTEFAALLALVTNGVGDADERERMGCRIGEIAGALLARAKELGA